MSTRELKKHSDWIKMWSGKCSINSCCQMGKEWTDDIKISGKTIYNSPIIFIIRGGITDCWATQKDKDNFGGRLAKRVKKDSMVIKEMADSLEFLAKKVFAFTKQNSRKKIDLEIYNDFWKIMTDYYLQHISVKYTPDYISPEKIKKYLPLLQKARVFAESVFKEQEKFMEIMASQIADYANFPKELVLCMTKEELRAYFEKSKVPKRKLLEERNLETALVFDSKKYKIFSGSQAENIERSIHPKKSQSSLRGVAAYRGKVLGRARIVLHPSKYKGKFEKGDILVTGMTRPEFSIFYKKAAAIVTDSGGVLSHAAIVAREMKIPCIIGTKIASKVLQDGDLVEVDANSGKVKILRS